MDFAINILDKINSNSGTVVVTGNTIGTVVESNRRGGFNDEEKKYKITGSVTSGVKTVIATISITAGTSKFFNKKPYIDFSDNIKLVKTSITRSSNLVFNKNVKSVTVYNFDLVYKNTEATTASDNVKLYLNYKDQSKSILDTHASTIGLIGGVRYGSDIIKRSGETRQITVFGQPKAGFFLRINEADLIKSDSGLLLNTIETSILNPKINGIKPMVDNTGKTINMISGTIGSDGTYSFTQKFPSNIAVSKKLNGAMEGDKIMDLDDTIGIRKGDQIIMQEIVEKRSASSTPRDIVTTTSSATRVLTQNNITAADNANAAFARNKSYYIHLEAKTNNQLGTSVPTTIPTHELTQNLDPIFSIKGLSHANFTINGVTAGTAHYYYWKGKPNMTPHQIKIDNNISSVYEITYTLDSDGGTTFAINSPNGIFDLSGRKSNSIIKNYESVVDKGYDFNISDIKTVLSGSGGNDIATITFRLAINSFSNEDCEVELNFEKLITIS